MTVSVVALDGTTAPADRPAIERLLRGGKLLWLDLTTVDEASLALLREVFALHPVALQDVAEFGQRPKIEDYGNVFYMIVYGAQGVGDALAEVHCFYAENFLITVRREPCAPLDQLRSSIQRPGGQLPTGNRPVRLILLHHIMDSLTDSYFPALSDLDDQIDSLQEKIFSRPREDQLAELFALQRWLIGVRKLVSPQRDMAATLVSGVVTLPGHSAEGEPYLRDLYDHLIRISDLVDSYRDLLSNAMSAYLSMVSNRLNEVMKQLTIIATVFLPLSFLTGFFGQNFSWLVVRMQGLGAFLLLGVGTEVVAVAGLYLLFKRRGWI